MLCALQHPCFTLEGCRYGTRRLIFLPQSSHSPCRDNSSSSAWPPPDEGLYFPGWPDAVALGMWPCQGRLSALDAAAAAGLLRGYRPGEAEAGAAQPGACVQWRQCFALTAAAH